MQYQVMTLTVGLGLKPCGHGLSGCEFLCCFWSSQQFLTLFCGLALPSQNPLTQAALCERLANMCIVLNTKNRMNRSPANSFSGPLVVKNATALFY